MKSKLLIPVLLLIAACTTNKPMTDEQKVAVKDEGSAVVKELFDALSVSNLEKFLSLMENSVDYSFTVGGEIYNYNKMLELANSNMPSIERQTFDTKFEQYIIVSPTCFIYKWQGRNGIYMKSGEEIMMEDYLATYCFRKHDDGWKLFAGHESEKSPFPIDTVKTQ